MTKIKTLNLYTEHTYLLTPWNRVLLEKLASLQLVKKFPAFYGTRRFLTALTSARHPSLSSASPVQYVPKTVSLFPFLRHETSSRGTPPRRTEWGSGLPPDCFVSRGSISPMSVSEQAVFYGEALLAPRPTPNLEGQGIPFSLGHHL